MLKRIIYIGNEYALRHRDLQLILSDASNELEVQRVPFEDIGVLLLDNPRTTLSQRVLQACAEHNIALVVCDQKHHPASLMLHLDTHSIQTELFGYQVEASLPLKKQLWKQTVEAKIRNQGSLLDLQGRDGSLLMKLSRTVQSGDTGNVEALASRHYWAQLMEGGFRRDRYGDQPNAALNYGYAILRAATARALSGSGLLPTLGIHHHNRYNAYCLADDIMEPYRPFVDQAVCEIADRLREEETLQKEDKAHLLGILNRDVLMGKLRRPLMTGLSHTTASLARCFEGKEKKIVYPALI